MGSVHLAVHFIRKKIFIADLLDFHVTLHVLQFILHRHDLAPLAQGQSQISRKRLDHFHGRLFFVDPRQHINGVQGIVQKVGIDLTDQHIQLAGSQFLLLIFDLFQKPLDIGKHFVVRQSDLIQFRVRVQFNGPFEIIPVKTGHRLVDRLDRFGKPLRKVHTQHHSDDDHNEINPRKNENDLRKSLIQHLVRHKRKHDKSRLRLPVGGQDAAFHMLSLKDHSRSLLLFQLLYQVCFFRRSHRKFFRLFRCTDLPVRVHDPDGSFFFILPLRINDLLQKSGIHFEKQHSRFMSILQASHIPSDEQCFFPCPEQPVAGPKPDDPGVFVSQIFPKTAFLHLFIRNAGIGPAVYVLLIVHVTVIRDTFQIHIGKRFAQRIVADLFQSSGLERLLHIFIQNTFRGRLIAVPIQRIQRKSFPLCHKFILINDGCGHFLPDIDPASDTGEQQRQDQQRYGISQVFFPDPRRFSPSCHTSYSFLYSLGSFPVYCLNRWEK